MRHIKLLLISIVVFILILFGMSLLFPSTVVISRAVDISANANDVYKKLDNCIAWKSWVTQLNDSSLRTFTATKIHSDKLDVTITAIQSDKIISEWRVVNGNLQESTMRIISASSMPNAITIQWQFEEHINWYQPWEKFASLVGDQVMGTMMENNLNNLKKQVEIN